MPRIFIALMFYRGNVRQIALHFWQNEQFGVSFVIDIRRASRKSVTSNTLHLAQYKFKSSHLLVIITLA